MNLNIPQPYTYWATLERVIDGDTVVLNIDLGFNVTLTGVHMRIYGIDCPEKNTEEGQDASDMPVNGLQVTLPTLYSNRRCTRSVSNPTRRISTDVF